MVEYVEVITSDLRALLFWAAVGVRNSKGGSYQSEIENIISQYAADIKHPIEPPALFKTDSTVQEGK